MITKKLLTILLSLVVIIIGIYMLASYAWPTPPAVSGLAFILVGYLHFMPFCPICNMICKK